MSTIIEALRSMGWIPPRRAPDDRPDKFARFYRSRAWRAARYAFIKTQQQPLRCKACGATSAQARICVDHIIAIKVNWSRRLDPTNFQLLCDDCNLGKGSRDQTDFRAVESVP